MKAIFYFFHYNFIYLLSLCFNFFNIKYPFWYLNIITDKEKNILIHLIRNDAIQKKYIIHKQNKVGTFIKKIKNNSNKYILIKNNFPYNVSKNIKHYVLWVNDNKTHISNKIIKNELNKKNISGRFCYGKNLTKHKSIPEIEHYHVFIAI